MALAACSRGGTTGEPHVLRIADNSDPSSLNPLLAHDQDTIGYDLLFVQTLVGLDERNRMIPVLAARVPTVANGDISADGTRITYHLRREARFADGTPVTSADVVFTYRAIVDPRNPVLSEDAYRRIVAIQAPDPHTVVIHLRRRWNAAVAELFAQADFAFGILPAHAFASTDVTHATWNALPFGSGPFRVTAWRRGSEIVLEPNPYYRPRPKLKRIVLSLIPTTQTSLVELRTHQVDIATIYPAQVPQAREIDDARLLVTPLNDIEMLMLQAGQAPLDDVRVRRAIAAAIDPSQIVRSSYGMTTRGDSFLPPVFDWHVHAPPVTTDASVKRPLSVTIAFESQRGSLMETIVQAQLRRAGIDASLKPYPPAEFNAPAGPLRSGGFTLAETGFIGGGDPEESVIYACSQRGPNGNNAMNYCDPQFERYFADQATTADPARRRADFIAMQRIIASGIPMIPLTFMNDIDAVNVRVNGFRRNMLEFPVDPASWDAR